MNTFDNIFSRRSVRSYNGEMLTESELELILKAGKAAPIGLKRYDTVHITLITDREMLKKIDGAASEAMGRPAGGALYNAPCFAVVSVNMSEMHSDNVGYSNAACVVENMALAAVELGIGSCHIWGAVRIINANEDLLKSLNLPKDFIPVCGIILGHTHEKYEKHEPSEISVSYI